MIPRHQIHQQAPKHQCSQGWVTTAGLQSMHAVSVLRLLVHSRSPFRRCSACLSIHAPPLLPGGPGTAFTYKKTPCVR